MNSRVHPKYKTKYRVSNWAEYDRALVQRGDIALWISTDAISAWKTVRSGRRGGQCKFSDLAIETALTLRLVFHLPLRQTEGFLRSLLSLLEVDLEAPDHTTLSRRSQQRDVHLQRAQVNERIHLIVDNTGTECHQSERHRRSLGRGSLEPGSPPFQSIAPGRPISENASGAGGDTLGWRSMGPVY